MAWEYVNFDYPVPNLFEKHIVWLSANCSMYFAMKLNKSDSWNYYAGNGSHALLSGKILTSYGSSEANAQTNYLTTTKDSNNKVLAILPTVVQSRYIRMYIESGDNITVYEYRPSTRVTAHDIVTGNLEITDELSESPKIVVTKSSVDRVIVGNISGTTYGIAGYDGAAATIFELSDANQFIAGLSITDTLLQNGNDIVIDSANKKISINSATYGDTGIQLDYNSGTPRAYIGDGNDQYFNFDGSNTSWKGTNTELSTTGKLSVSNIDCDGGTVGGWNISATKIESDSTGSKISLNKSKNRISIFKDGSEKVVMGYLDGLNTNASPSLQWGADDYGFYATDGNHLKIDGNASYISGNWIIEHDAAYKVNDNNNNTIIKMGTDSGKKGMFIYNTSGTQLAEYTGDSILVGDVSSSQYMQYTIADGATFRGGLNGDDITAGTVVVGRTEADVTANNTASAINNQGDLAILDAVSTAQCDTTIIVGGYLKTSLVSANSITATEIKADTITSAQIAAEAITATEIKADTITANELSANSVTATEINVNELSAITASVGTVTAGKIQSSNYNASDAGMEIDLDNAKISVYEASGLVIQSGGGITVKGSGDLNLESVSGKVGRLGYNDYNNDAIGITVTNGYQWHRCYGTSSYNATYADIFMNDNSVQLRTIHNSVDGHVAWYLTHGSHTNFGFQDDGHVVRHRVRVDNYDGFIETLNPKYNTGVGNDTFDSLDSGYYNVSFGDEAAQNMVNGSCNTIIGAYANYNGSSIQNGGVYLGYKAGYNETNSSRLYISNSNTSSPLIYGEFDNKLLRINDKLQIGTTASINEFSTDGTLAGDSDLAVPTEKAVKTYVDAIDFTKIKTGQYTGNGSTSQAITGVGFQPVYVLIIDHYSSGDNSTSMFWKTDQMAAAMSVKEDLTVRVTTDKIIAIGSDGFTVDDGGSDNNPNKNSITYDYVCFG